MIRSAMSVDVQLSCSPGRKRIGRRPAANRSASCTLRTCPCPRGQTMIGGLGTRSSASASSNKPSSSSQSASSRASRSCSLSRLKWQWQSGQTICDGQTSRNGWAQLGHKQRPRRSASHCALSSSSRTSGSQLSHSPAPRRPRCAGRARALPCQGGKHLSSSGTIMSPSSSISSSVSPSISPSSSTESDSLVLNSQSQNGHSTWPSSSGAGFSAKSSGAEQQGQTSRGAWVACHGLTFPRWVGSHRGYQSRRATPPPADRFALRAGRAACTAGLWTGTAPTNRSRARRAAA